MSQFSMAAIGVIRAVIDIRKKKTLVMVNILSFKKQVMKKSKIDALIREEYHDGISHQFLKNKLGKNDKTSCALRGMFCAKPPRVSQLFSPKEFFVSLNIKIYNKNPAIKG